MRNDFTGGYSSAVEILESFLLAGLKAACIAIYLFYNPSPFEKMEAPKKGPGTYLS